MSYYDKRVPFSDLVGNVIKNIIVGGDEIRFECETGEEYLMYHEQDCCESVSVEDVIGDINDLIGNPILKAEETTNRDMNIPKEQEYRDESWTWTFYHLATIKGYVDIRWYGSSNGYYSEGVDFIKLK